MVRIISGSLRGRKLEFSENAALRPSSDRLRSGLFSALESRSAIAGRRVLDLYAGTGSLGFEALSRGAAGVTFVESDQKITAELEQAARKLGVESQCAIVRGTVASGLKSDRVAAKKPFGLVFADPPYDGDYSNLAHLLVEESLIESGTFFVFETRAGSEPAWNPPVSNLRAVKDFAYGDSIVQLFEFE